MKAFGHLGNRPIPLGGHVYLHAHIRKLAVVCAGAARVAGYKRNLAEKGAHQLRARLFTAAVVCVADKVGIARNRYALAEIVGLCKLYCGYLVAFKLYPVVYIALAAAAVGNELSLVVKDEHIRLGPYFSAVQGKVRLRADV